MAQLGLVFKVFVHQRHRQLFGDKVTLCGNGDGFAQTFGQAFQPFGGALVEQIAVDRSGQRHLFFNAVEPGGQNQANDQIWVAGGIGAAQLQAAEFAGGGRQAHQLAAVLAYLGASQLPNRV